MPPRKSAAERARADGRSKIPPKCKVQEDSKGKRMPGLTDIPMGGTDTAASGKGMAPSPVYEYDPLPCLDDEPEGGLRWVYNPVPCAELFWTNEP